MQLMCAPSRWPFRVLGLLGACIAVTGRVRPVRAEQPGISGDPTPPAAVTAPAPAATDTPPTPGVSVAPFTPAPAPAFTPNGGNATPATAPSPWAQAYPPPAFAASAPPRIAQPEDHARDPRWNDAHVDRVVLVPTAETHPAGTWYLSSYDILLLQAGYALTDRTQLTLTLTPPLDSALLMPVDMTVKTVLARTERVRVAATGSVSGLLGYEAGAVFLGRVGGVAQLCLDDDCRSSINMAGNATLLGSTVLFLDGVGAILRTNDTVAFLLELQSVLPLSRDNGDYHAFAGAGGIRLSGKAWGVDLAFEAPLDRRTHPQVIPVLAATYRFLP